MLEVRLTKRFGGFTLDLSAATEARVLGLVGPSGSGKTTLLNCIAGMDHPDEGVVRVDEHTLVDTADSHCTLPVARRGVGYVFQEGLLFPHLSVEANLRYGFSTQGVGPSFSDVVEVLELTKLLRRGTDALSGGEARRVAIGRALLSAPKLLLLDEPLAGLDRRLAKQTLAYLHEVLRTFQVPAVYVSHTLSDVMFLCEQAWLLVNGRLAASGPPRLLLSNSADLHEPALRELENVFLAQRDPGEEDDLPVFRVGDQHVVVAADVEAHMTEAILAVHASDILLALQRPEQISARNVLAGRVTKLESIGGRVLVFVRSGFEWMALLTPRAITMLALKPGAEVYVIIKASAFSVVKTR